MFSVSVVIARVSTLSKHGNNYGFKALFLHCISQNSFLSCLHEDKVLTSCTPKLIHPFCHDMINILFAPDVPVSHEVLSEVSKLKQMSPSKLAKLPSTWHSAYTSTTHYSTPFNMFKQMRERDLEQEMKDSFLQSSKFSPNLPYTCFVVVPSLKAICPIKNCPISFSSLYSCNFVMKVFTSSNL